MGVPKGRRMAGVSGRKAKEAKGQRQEDAGTRKGVKRNRHQPAATRPAEAGVVVDGDHAGKDAGDAAGVERVDRDWTLRQHKLVAEHLREVRESQGLTRVCFAERAKIGLNQVQRWEMYGTIPDPPSLLKIANALTALGYEPPEDPFGWTIDQIMQQLPFLSTNKDVRRILQVNDQTIRNWKAGKSVPSLDSMLRIESLYRTARG